jgi:hypothetical protein
MLDRRAVDEYAIGGAGSRPVARALLDPVLAKRKLK